MRSGARLCAALAMIGLLGPACADRLGDVEAGDCFQTGTAAAFGWGTEVPCDQPHTVEVFAVREMTDTLGGYPRQALEEAGSPARLQYLALVTGFCEPAWSEYSGFGDLGDSLAPGAVVLPAIYGDMALEAAPIGEWDAGNKIVLCYQVFGRPGTDAERAIVVDRPVLAGLGSAGADVPAEVRDCAIGPAPGRAEQRVLCLLPHDREYLGHLDLAQFVDRAPGLHPGFLDRFDSSTAPAEDRAVLDGLCGQVFAPLLGAPRPDVALLAQVYTHDPGWGWAEDGSYHAACFASTARPVTGSVVGIGDRPLGAPRGSLRQPDQQALAAAHHHLAGVHHGPAGQRVLRPAPPAAQ
jgi:hypothetical protein